MPAQSPPDTPESDSPDAIYERIDGKGQGLHYSPASSPDSSIERPLIQNKLFHYENNNGSVSALSKVI